MAVITKDLGAVSAYAVAVANGFTGTEAEWEQYIADAANNAMNAAGSATAAANSAASAAQSATEAATSKVAAAGSAVDAENSALVAGNHAAAAAASATAAETAETGAETAKTAAEAAQAAAEAVAASIPEDYTELTDEVSGLKSALDDTGEDGTIYLGDFVQGTLDSSGNISASNYYIATETQHVFSFPTIFEPEDGYRYNIYKYIDGAYVQTSLVTGKKYVIPANMPFKLVIGKTTSSTLKPKDGYNKVKIKGYSGFYCWHNSNDIDGLKAGRCLLPFLFRNGSDATGVFAGYVNYRVTNEEFISFSTDTVIYIEDGYKVGPHLFDSDGTYVSDAGWHYGTYLAKANTKYRFIIAKATEDTSSVADLQTFYTALTMETPFMQYVNGAPSLNPLRLGFVQNGKTKLVAHAGYSSDGSPENTIPAYTDAGKIGYWGIEADLQQTYDGYYVMCHDTTVDRTTDGTGTISQMTLDQIRALHISGNDDLQIPTFEEYLGICKMYGCVPVIEIKSTVTNTKASFEAIIAIVEAFGLKDQCIFIGSKYAISYFRQADSIIPFMPVYQNGLDYVFDTELAALQNYQNVGMDWDYLSSVTADQAKKLHAKKMLFGTFTVDTVANVRNAFAAGVDFVTTNTVKPTD